MMARYADPTDRCTVPMNRANPDEFDVFLSYQSGDRPLAEELATRLTATGLRVFLDRWELRPGFPWQDGLERGVRTSKAVAACIGTGGLAAWQGPEIQAFIARSQREEIPVIPVLLPGSPDPSELTLFLQNYTWVDMRQGLTEQAWEDLLWGITDRRPVGRPEGRSPGPRRGVSGSRAGRQEPKRPGLPPAVPTTRQPLPGEAWAVTAAALLGVFIGLGRYLVSHASQLGSSGLTQPAYYFLLVLLGLTAASVLVGGLRSAASFSGSTPWGRLEVTGAAVIAGLVVVAGFFYARPADRFNLTVRAFDEHGQPIRAGGSLSVYLAQAIQTAPLTPQGEATFKEISRTLHDRTTRVVAEVKGYRLQDPLKEYRLDQEVVEVTMVPEPAPSTDGGPITEPVVQLIPGWGVLEELPEVKGPGPSHHCALRIHVGGMTYDVTDVRRQTILLGPAAAAAQAAQSAAAGSWLATAPAIDARERRTLEDIARKPPRVVPTPPLQGDLEIEFVRGRAPSEKLGPYHVSSSPGVQPIFLSLPSSTGPTP
jgi:hypothetical protein